MFSSLSVMNVVEIDNLFARCSFTISSRFTIVLEKKLRNSMTNIKGCELQTVVPSVQAYKSHKNWVVSEKLYILKLQIPLCVLC